MQFQHHRDCPSVQCIVERCEDRVDGRVVRIVRAGASLRPRHDVVVQVGDVLVLDVPAENVAQLRHG